MDARHLSCAPVGLKDSLAEAEALCRKRGGNLTPLRKQVLTLLLDAERPAKAYDMLGKVRDDGDAKPPTIYRALEFLVEMGLAHKIETLNAFVACEHWKHGHTAVFLICSRCGHVGELHAVEGTKKLNQEIAAVKFRMSSAVIELTGVCEACA